MVMQDFINTVNETTRALEGEKRALDAMDVAGGPGGKIVEVISDEIMREVQRKMKR